MSLLIILALAYVVGLVIYVFKGGSEAPEGFVTDAEHDSAGNKLPKTSPRYWFSVVAEFLWSKPAAKIRKLFGVK